MVARWERRKDAAQQVAESAVERVGAVITIVTRAVGDVIGEVGGLLSDVAEVQDANRRARLDAGAPPARRLEQADPEA